MFLEMVYLLECFVRRKISMVLCLYVLACVAWNDLFYCKFCDYYYMHVVSRLYVPLCVDWNGLFYWIFCDNYHIVLVFNFYFLNTLNLQRLCSYPTLIISNKGHISGFVFHCDIFLHPGSWCSILITSMLCSLYEMDSGM